MIENLDNLVLMLTSKDIEVRELVGNYLDKNYKLGFNIYRGINYTKKYTMVLDHNELNKNYFWCKNSVKSLINCIINFPNAYSNEEIYTLINLILKYNENFR